MHGQFAPSIPNRYLVVGSLGLALIPFLFVVFAIQRYFVNLPVHDQWFILPLFQAYHSGDFPFRELWQPYNTHRSPVSLSILLILGIATNWNHAYEVAANVVVAVITFGLFYLLYKQALGRVGRGQAYLMLPILSIFLFSFVRARTWLMGWMLNWTLLGLLVVACLFVLSRSPRRELHYAIAFLMAVLATFTFASGILVWVAALPCVAFAANRSPKRMIWETTLWCVGALVSYFVYYLDFSISRYGVLSPISEPVKFLECVFMVLGAAVYSWDRSGAVVAGVIGSLFFIGLIVEGGAPSSSLRFQARLPLLCLATFGVLSAAAVAYGRGAIFPQTLMWPKNTLFPTYFWIALLLLGSLALTKEGKDESAYRGVWRRYAFPFLVLITLAGTTFNNVSLYHQFRGMYLNYRIDQDLLPRIGDNPDRVISVGSVPVEIRGDPERRSKLANEYLPYLKERKMSLFAEVDRPDSPPLDVYREFIQYLVEAGHIGQAIKTYNTVIEIVPDNPELYVERARLQMAAGRDRQATISCYRALALDPDFQAAKDVLQELQLREGVRPSMRPGVPFNSGEPPQSRNGRAQ